MAIEFWRVQKLSQFLFEFAFVFEVNYTAGKKIRSIHSHTQTFFLPVMYLKVEGNSFKRIAPKMTQAQV